MPMRRPRDAAIEATLHGRIRRSKKLHSGRIPWPERLTRTCLEAPRPTRAVSLRPGYASPPANGSPITWRPAFQSERPRMYWPQAFS